MELIPRDWNLPIVLRSRLGDEGGRQRAMVAEGHLLLVLHELPKPGESDRTSRLFWRSPDGRWDSSSLGGGVQSLLRHLAEFAKAIDTLEERTAQAQQARDYFAILQQVTPLQRTSRNLASALQDAREGIPADRDLIVARDRANSLERGCELLHADASHGLDFTIARQGEEMAKASQDLALAGHRLNLLAAVFLPISAVASVFGMNLVSGLEGIAVPWLFWLALLLGLVIGLVIKGTLARPVRIQQPDSRRG
jgi:hypothetical protein